MFYYLYDPTYILVVIAGLFSLWASYHVNSTYKKYSHIRSMSGMTGAMAAERILQSQGIYDVRIERVSGNLTDHYDPSSKVLRLSDSTYGNASVAAVGVAAHECGHALQHAKGYAPLQIRGALVPIANLGSSAGIILFMVGLFFYSSMGDALLTIGIILFSAAVLFQLVTLPVEFDASARAVKLLESTGILGQNEVRVTKKVLGAAALTYVAGAATAILQLLRLILIAGGRNRD
ncbi:MAG: zinc metallopeptidase [Lachnospiraceae bacterium]|nr:zinc metallopeptidase [Lachnospiraceae bacterium]